MRMRRTFEGFPHEKWARGKCYTRARDPTSTRESFDTPNTRQWGEAIIRVKPIVTVYYYLQDL